MDRRWFYSLLKSDKMNVFAVILFISLSITVGVLTVCLTSPKPSMFEFQIDLELKIHLS